MSEPTAVEIIREIIERSRAMVEARYEAAMRDEFAKIEQTRRARNKRKARARARREEARAARA